MNKIKWNRTTRGVLESENRYMPFGELREDVGTLLDDFETDDGYTDFGYTGQRAYMEQSGSPGFGLMDNKSCVENPKDSPNRTAGSITLGRFTQPDTIVPDLTNSQAWNRYSYTLNNPVKYIDPSGHVACLEGMCNSKEHKDTIDKLKDDLRASTMGIYGVEIDERFSLEEVGWIAEVLRDYAKLLGGAEAFMKLNIKSIGIWAGGPGCGGACNDDGNIYFTRWVLNDPYEFMNNAFAPYTSGNDPAIANSEQAFKFLLAHEISHSYLNSAEGEQFYQNFQNTFPLGSFNQTIPKSVRGFDTNQLVPDVIAGYLYAGGDAFQKYNGFVRSQFPSQQKRLPSYR